MSIPAPTTTDETRTTMAARMCGIVAGGFPVSSDVRTTIASPTARTEQNQGTVQLPRKLQS